MKKRGLVRPAQDTRAGPRKREDRKAGCMQQQQQGVPAPPQPNPKPQGDVPDNAPQKMHALPGSAVATVDVKLHPCGDKLPHTCTCTCTWSHVH
eukprot:1160356-Pelagomonas_calceolata.AAC.7